MRRKSGSHKPGQPGKPSRRRPDTGIPEVPTFQAPPADTMPPASSPATTADDLVEDAVRRMVEAAYT